MKTLRTLIADDKEESRSRMAEILSRFGDIEIAGEARGGLEAVEEVRSTNPDLVFLTICISGLGGFEAAWRIREFSDETGIVLVSDEERTTFRALGVLLDVDGYARKNCLEEDLTRIVEHLRVHCRRTDMGKVTV